MTYQPSGDSLLIDRVPLNNPAWKLRYQKQVEKAKKEGKKKCSVEGCLTNLRVDNRERGVCDGCWRKKNR